MEITYSKDMQAFQKTWKLATEKKDKKAQYSVGEFYFKLEKYEEAVKWFEIAAKNKSIEAGFKLAECYHSGKGVKKDYKRAIRWYQTVEIFVKNEEVARCKPLNKTQLAIIDYYCENEEFQKYMDEALDRDNPKPPDNFEYDYTAAIGGDSSAQYRLAYRYYYGRKTKVDKEKTLYWCHESAKQGNEHAICMLAEVYEKLHKFKESAYWYRKYAFIRMNELNKSNN